MGAATFRPAVASDLPRLAAVEVEAGEVFRTVGMAEVAEHAPDLLALRDAIAAGLVWVVDVGGEVAGYVSAEVLDQNAHVAQVSVAPNYAGRRLGQALVDLVEAWGRDRGCPATTLTTFRDVPWNGPYYARLGYRELVGDGIGPELARVMAREAALPGIDAASRCAMVKTNGRTAAQHYAGSEDAATSRRTERSGQ